MRLAGRRVRAFRQLRSSSVLQMRRVPPSELLEDRTLLTTLLSDASLLAVSASGTRFDSFVTSPEPSQSARESIVDIAAAGVVVFGGETTDAGSIDDLGESNGETDCRPAGDEVLVSSGKPPLEGPAGASAGLASVSGDLLINSGETLLDVAAADNVFNLRAQNRAVDLQTTLLDRFLTGTGFARSAILTGEFVTARLRAVLLSGRAVHDGSEGRVAAAESGAAASATVSASSGPTAGQVPSTDDVSDNRPVDLTTTGPRTTGQNLTQRLVADIISDVLEVEQFNGTVARQADAESSRSELLALADSPVENSSNLPRSHSLQLASGRDSGFSQVEVDFASDLQAAAQPLVMVAGTVSAALQSIAASLSFVLRGDWSSAGSLAPHAEFVEPLLNPGLAAADQWTRRSSALSDDGSWVDAVVLVPQTDRPFDIRDFGRLQLEDTAGLPVEFAVTDSAQDSSASRQSTSTDSETTTLDAAESGNARQTDPVTALRVERRPLHGRLNSSARHGIDYRPDPGFRGIDSAVMRVFGEAGRSARVLVVFEGTESTDVVFRQPDQLFDELVQQSRP